MKLIAAAFNSQLYTSTDAGVSWTARESNRSWLGVASSADGTKLVAAVNNDQLYTSAAQLGLVFTPAANANGTTYASFTFQVQDDGGTANSGVDLDLTPNLITFNVTPINDAPVASFIANPNPSAPTQIVSFDARASTAGRSDLSIVSYAWNFGDGGIASGVTAQHAFALFGNYTVTLTVTDNNSPAKIDTESHVINVSQGNQAPTANAGGPYVADLGSGLTLDGTGSTDPNLGQGDAIVSYQWLVNGSLALSGATPSLTAAQITSLGAGIFSVQLTVTDSLGATNSGASTLTVNQGNQAPVNIVPGAQTTLEDTALVFNQANGNLISVSDVDTATVTVTLAVTNGALTLSGTTGLTGLTGNGTGTVSFGGTLASINSAMTGLSYLSTLNFNGSDQLTLTTADGVAAPVLSTVALTITPVNDAPAGADQTITTPGNTAYTFALADFGFSDPNDSPANSFQAVKITTLPEAGTLTVNGAPVNAGDLISLSATGATWTAHESNRNWHAVASSADGTKLVAAVWLGQLYTSTDSGLTWAAHENDQQWQSVASSADGTKLVASVFLGQLYTSTDSGVTWTARETDRHWDDVASSADGVKLVAADGLGRLYTSTDAGVNWTPRESSRTWFGVASSADGTKLVASDFQGEGFGGQLYTSTDSGQTWTAHESNRAWGRVASSADGMKLIASDTAGTLYTSTDAGVSWTARTSILVCNSVASSADGMKLVAVNPTQLYTSTDAGVTCTAHVLPIGSLTSVASSADGTKLVAGDGVGQLWTSIASLGLVFTPALNANGTPYTSFTFQVKDDEDTLNGGANLDPMPNILTFNVTAVNQGVGNWTYSGIRNRGGVSSAESASGTYAVAADGTLTFDAGGTSLTGNVLAGGSTFILANTSGEPIEIGVGVEKGGTFSNATLSGSYGVTFHYSDATAGPLNTITIPDVPSTVNVPFPDYAFNTALGTVMFDGGGSVPLPPPMGTTVSFGSTKNVTLASPGQVDSSVLTLDSDTLVSFDGVMNNPALQGSLNGGASLDPLANTVTINMTPGGTSATFGNLVEETVPLDLELVTVTAAPASVTVQSTGLAADGSLAYVQRSWVTDFVAASLTVSPIDPDEELVIALPALAGV